MSNSGAGVSGASSAKVSAGVASSDGSAVMKADAGVSRASNPYSTNNCPALSLLKPSSDSIKPRKERAPEFTRLFTLQTSFPGTVTVTTMDG